MPESVSLPVQEYVRHMRFKRQHVYGRGLLSGRGSKR